MFAFLRPALPVRTANAANNPVTFEDGRSTLTFKPNASFMMRNRIPPTTAAHGPSILQPPFHYHIHQSETFHVVSGVGTFFRGISPQPWTTLTSAPGGQATGHVDAGRYHRFENASATDDLVVDIQLDPEDFDNEERFFRNFFGYLDDCRKAKSAPSLFQLMVFLHSADTPLALPLPWEWLGVVVSRAFLIAVAYFGRFVLGYQSNYEEYYVSKKGR